MDGELREFVDQPSIGAYNQGWDADGGVEDLQNEVRQAIIREKGDEPKLGATGEGLPEGGRPGAVRGDEEVGDPAGVTS